MTISGAEREMCCAGCQAVAQTIVASGLGSYYAHRDALPEAPREALPSELMDLGLFDSPDFQAGFVTEPAPHEREATLLLEGITCSACVWLNEQHLAKQPGVLATHINYATRRARVRWDSRRARLSDILGAIRAIGYRAFPYDPAREEVLAAKERRGALWRLFVAGFGMMQVMMYALPEYVAGDGEMTSDMSALLRWASLVLTVPVMVYSAAPFFRGAWRDLRVRRLGMDVPVAIGIGTTFAASLWATLAGHGAVYFDSVAMFVFFLLCGRYLELLARQRAVRGAEELSKILPAATERLPNWPDPEGIRVDVSSLKEGDIVRVKPGEVIPADGTVVLGSSSADESLLTGESAPVGKRPDSAVIAGSVNGGGPLVVRVVSVGDSTRLACIRRLMQRAEGERPRIAELADRLAGRFVAGVLTVGALTGAVWWSIDPAQALWVCVSVLVVSCPCALSLATPVAMTVATTALGRSGVLVTRAHAVETLARADHFVFDKTGTLTTGRIRVEQVQPLGSMPLDEIQGLALALERGSEHRIAEAIRGAGWEVPIPDVGEAVIATGQGVAARRQGVEYRLGRLEFVAEVSGPGEMTQVAARHSPLGTLFLGRAGEVLAAFVLSDALRDDAPELIAYLRTEVNRVSILSGDADPVVREIGARLGIADAHGGLLPEEKHAHVRRLQDGGDVVAMVGDGVNDGPVLAQAHVSIAMGEGTALARNQADVVLLGRGFGPLGAAHRLSRGCMRIVRQNLAWALFYNLVAVPAAMAGVVTPWMAGVGMSASSLLVILNALRIQRIL